MNEIIPGLTHTLSLQINDRSLLSAFTSGLCGIADPPPVFATALMVGFMEWACIETLRPYLKDGENTLGTHIYLSHAAAARMGTQMTAIAELIEVQEDTLRFRVDCYDEGGLLGSGFHERKAVGTGRFRAKVRKAGQPDRRQTPAPRYLG